MVLHTQDYKPTWRKPFYMELSYRDGQPQMVAGGLDPGIKGWAMYLNRALKHWPFPKEELRHFGVLFQRGDFPMLLKGDPNAASKLNAPVFANTNNGFFHEVLMPVSWRPQFDENFTARRNESFRLADNNPWRRREDTAVWRGSVGCATGCGARGKFYFPRNTIDVCDDDMGSVTGWNSNEIGASWGCGDHKGHMTSAYLGHPRMQLVTRFSHGECGIDAGFHTWGRHRSWVGARARDKVSEWTKSEMTDEETATHKYVFVVGNNGYSDRSWRMFALGAVVLLVDDGWKEFYFDLLQPWVHYVPISPDMSDACDKVQWARENPEKAEQIARNGREFVENCMTESFIDLYVAEMIRQLGELYALGKANTS
uniref:Glycosyl transferase CAP10 domain-containing protein n=1 Tax=Alexandrium andersonii TaxID=327968 RepID=A0A7S2CH12_9DINO